MPVVKTEELPIQTPSDIVVARQAVRSVAAGMGFSLVDQTKIVTAASELARNTLDYGGGGVLRLDQIEENPRKGVRLTFEDHGPGIPDIQQALKDGFTTGGGLGLGLGGAKRLVNDFDVQSAPGQGTRVTITRWK